MTRFSILICLLSSFLFALSAVAQQKVYTDPDQVDEDFAIQGEYLGSLQIDDVKHKFGAQVIALGNGQFDSTWYRGGLPGEGWDPEQSPAIKALGKRDGETIRFENDHAVVNWWDSELHVSGHDGNMLGKLKKVVRKSSTLGKKPPADAVVLFNGQGAEQWEGGVQDDQKLLQQGTTSKRRFGSHKIHIEFRLPYMPEARGQARGNSGIYVQGRYEVQMLDSFGLEGKMNECGGVYSVADCPFNMCYPPLSWQTYDIDFTAAKYDSDGKLVANPRMTIMHNGVVLHNDLELPGDRNTTAAPLKAGPEKGPIYLQNHGNPVRYRNIWVVETDK